MRKILKRSFLTFLSCALLFTMVLIPKSIVNAQTEDGISNNSVKILTYDYPWDFKQSWFEFKFVPQGNGTAKLKPYKDGKFLNLEDIPSNLSVYKTTLFETSNIYGYSRGEKLGRGLRIRKLAEFFGDLTFTYGADYIYMRPIPLYIPDLPPLGRSAITDYEEFEEKAGLIYDEGFSGVKIEGPVFANFGNRDINDDLRFSGLSKLFKFRVEKDGLYKEYRKQVKIPDGEYIIQTYGNTDKVVQAISSNVDTGEYKGLNTQKWKFEYDNMLKAYKIKTGIGVLSLKDKVGPDVICRLDENADDQYWYIEDAGDGNYRLVNAVEFPKRLNLDANNKNISVSRNSGNPKQLFKLVNVEKEESLVDGEWKISCKGIYNKILSLADDRISKSNVIGIGDTNSLKQKWRFEYNSYKDAFKIRNSNTLECLTWKPESGTNVYGAGSLEIDSQYWEVEDVGNGYFVIKNCHDSNMVLELSGQNVMVDKRNDSDYQKWKLIR